MPDIHRFHGLRARSLFLPRRTDNEPFKMRLGKQISDRISAWFRGNEGYFP
ncbi:MAG: hypothetical protein SWY16_08220 [Cyanobacteriota bacterium]|nr:hypothetical protein [Cyanobacteriota bacterium]